jgi:hypothetical protein
MSLPELERWQRPSLLRLQIHVAAIGTFAVLVLARIALERDHQARLRFDVPHHVDQIAAVLSAQLEPDLTAALTGRERHVDDRRPQIRERKLDRCTRLLPDPGSQQGRANQKSLGAGLATARATAVATLGLDAAGGDHEFSPGDRRQRFRGPGLRRSRCRRMAGTRGAAADQ